MSNSVSTGRVASSTGIEPFKLFSATSIFKSCLQLDTVNGIPPVKLLVLNSRTETDLQGSKGGIFPDMPQDSIEKLRRLGRDHVFNGISPPSS
ncbi:hypothetical protein MIMGU_mgv1a019336mg [Erythranthe guttata]|uniref:Uncharacterized protein n=1 Tax=Erythranthe guttata TaxID=4155 RepID=A0A022QRN1_ERYGU|nr:hypothetical protein MIMGU_mgv1a019336mg [Erythranthe guttata]